MVRNESDLLLAVKLQHEQHAVDLADIVPHAVEVMDAADAAEHAIIIANAASLAVAGATR